MYRAAEIFASEEQNIASLNEQQQFIEILHRESKVRGGFAVQFTATGDKPMNIWAQDLAALSTDSLAHNTYISINSFRGKKRDSDKFRTINCVYLDLDCHNGSMEEIRARIDNTKAVLHQAYDEDVLPRPTMITESGRGLGIFYVLKRSIANTAATQKQVRFWKYICSEVAGMYSALLSENENLLEVDPKVVGDISRVVRLPLTRNTKSDSICHLSYVNKTYFGDVIYYTLSQFKPYIKNYNVYEKAYQDVRNEVIKAKVIDFDALTKPYLLARVQKLLRAQEVLSHLMEGYRELLCFFFYNTIKQIVPLEEARDKLYAFNRGFKWPIENDNELENIIECVNKNKGLDGTYEGYYKISDKNIIEKLDLKNLTTPEQFAYIGFGSSLKEIRRAEAKENTKKKREERNRLVLDYILNSELTYKEIAAAVGVSERTVKTIAKNNNVGRYQTQDKPMSICAASELSEEREVVAVHSERKAVSPALSSGAESKVQFSALWSIVVNRKEKHPAIDTVSKQLTIWDSDLIGIGPPG